MVNLITVSGDRQAGKSHALRWVALMSAIEGQRVSYYCANHTMDREAFLQMERMCWSEWAHPLVKKVYRAHGNRAIVFNSGGEIRFWSIRGVSRPCTGVWILDEVDPTNVIALPGVERIYYAPIADDLGGV